MRKLLPLFALALLSISGFGQEISPYLAGQNAWMPKGYGGAVYNGELDNLWSLVKESKVQMVRIGGLGVEFNLPTGDEYVKLIDSIKSIGAEPMVQVPNGRGKYTASQAAAIVEYVNITKQRNVKYWIIGNEPNLAIGGRPPIVNVAGIAAYIKEWSSAMKAVDPSILIVGPECSFYDSNYYPGLIGGAHDITGKDASGQYYIDVISFHHYPFNGTQIRSQVTANAQSLASTVDNLTGLMNTANALHSRTGGKELTWALTEFNVDYKNPAVNTVEGLGVHSFLNGQFWAEVFNVGMQKKALSIMPWSIHEMGGNRTDLDLGYIDGKSAVAKPRSSYYHEMLIAENFNGTHLPASDNQSMVTAFGSVHNGTIAVMLINKSQTDNFNYTLQLSSTPINDASPLKINLSSNVNRQFQDKLFNQSTVVLLFDAQGSLVKKIVYSLQHAIDTLPPTYLNPGERVTLVNFYADRTVACVVQDQEPVIFTSNIYGDYTSLNWDFGDGAEPRTASGVGPFSVTYTTTGEKTVLLTATGADGVTVVVNKPNFIKASSCVRSPYATTVIPGVLKAIQYDYGGEGAAYHDTEETNRGSLINPGVPRADEGVDTNTDTGNGNVGWTENGEWLKYTVKIQKSGVFRVVARVASQVDGGLIRLSVNNVDKTGVVPVPKTSSWTDYQDVILGNIVLEASENATIKIEIVKNAFNLDTFTFAEYELPGIVINRIYNATSTADGMSDAVELLITKDHTDIRGLMIKDFDANLTLDNGGKYQFKDNALWSDLRKGTTIVLRKLASGITDYAQDTDTTDFKIDLLLENTDYIANIAASGHQFNLTNTDMVLLKVGSISGADNAVHAFATNNGGGSVFYNAVTSHKLVSTIILNTGAFQYPLNPDKAITDFNGAKTGNSTDTNLNWGDGYGTNNIAYIYSLRGLPPPLPPPSIVVNRVYNGSNDADGRFDAVELLVIKDRLDIRNLIVKDFETSNTTDNGGKYRFNDNPLWQNLRSGTTIVLRKIAGPAGYVQDTNGSDFTIDILMSNTTYLTNLAPTLHYNITQYDMVLIKSGTLTGVDGAIHAFATKGGGPTSFFPTVNSYKLVSPDGTDAGAGAFHYPLNPTKKLTDFNGTQGAISKSAAVNWGHGFGQNNIDYIQSLRNAATPVPPAVVVNRVYNGSNDADGRTDAVELLVVTDHFDARNLIVKDFENNSATDNGGKYRLNDIPFWQDLRAGTTIVLRKLAGPAGYVQDTDPSDFTIDLLMENTSYVTNLGGGAVFNITQYDMVIVKTGAATGVEGTIHAFATKGGSNSPFFQFFNSYTLFSPDGTDAGGGSFHYPLNPTKTLSDFEGMSGSISKSAAINWGYGFGQNNVDYIQGIRNSVVAPPTNLAATASGINKINLTWSDNSGNETGFEIVRSSDGIIYSQITTVSANNTAYTDSCLNYNTPYHYKIRAGEGTVNSSWSALANATTGSLPSITLPDLTGECTVSAEAPTSSDNCGGIITATTNDSLTYSEQGSFTITWNFDYGNGNIITADQAVIIADTTPPLAIVLPDVAAECAVNLTAPVATDNCKGEITGSTTDPLTYSEQGSYVITWRFDDGNGNISTTPQNVIVDDTTAPMSPVLDNATGECSVTVTAPATSDNCAGEITGTTTDALTYSEQGSHVITWSFDDGNGNISTATQNVIVDDITAPVVPVLADATGECSVAVTAPTTSDKCVGEITGTTTDPVTYTEQGTYIVTWTFDDGNGNISNATQNVIVEDDTAPIAITQNISVTLVSGAATITASSINNGSFDECGIQSLMIDQSSFDCSDIGENTVMLTMTDNSGNISTAEAIVTIIGAIPDPTIMTTKTDNTFTGLDDKTIAIGYGAQNITLIASNSSIVTYEWSPATHLSSTTEASPVFTPTEAGSYTFDLSVTNEFGCSSSASVTIKVIDVRNGNKVLVCTKNGHTISVRKNAVDAHLKKGSTLGMCENKNGRNIITSVGFNFLEHHGLSILSVYPNPIISKATVSFSVIRSDKNVSVDLYDLSGTKIQNLYAGPVTAFQEYSYEIDRAGLSSGIYFVRLTGSKISVNYKVLVSR